MRYFTEAELRCKCGCGLLALHPGFAEALDGAREEFGRPMVVTSCCRCNQHNAKVGGHPASLHIGDYPSYREKGQLGALAADISTPDGQYRGALAHVLWRHGFSVGVHRLFLHGDLRSLIGMPQQMFLY